MHSLFLRLHEPIGAIVSHHLCAFRDRGHLTAFTDVNWVLELGQIFATLGGPKPNWVIHPCTMGDPGPHSAGKMALFHPFAIFVDTSTHF